MFVTASPVMDLYLDIWNSPSSHWGSYTHSPNPPSWTHSCPPHPHSLSFHPLSSFSSDTKKGHDDLDIHAS